MSELFRPEAVEHATRRLTGDVVLASPLSLKLLGGFFVVVIGAALAFASLATYARKETVAGWIVPQGGLIRVTARDGGIVESIPTAEGQRVAAGASLAVLRLSTNAGAGDVGAALQRSLAAEGAATNAEAQSSLLKLQTQKVELESRGADLDRELAETRARVETTRQRQLLADDQVARGEKLAARGFLAPQQLDQLKFTALGAAQDASQARGAVIDLQRQIGDLSGEIAAVPQDLANVQAQAAQNQANLSQRRTATQSQSTFVAIAPIAGRVVAIPVQLGQAVAAGAAVAVLTPRDSPLTAELYVPSKAIGFVQKGQEVRLMYQAFPYQTFGTGKGVVTSISPTVLAPSEVAIPGLVVQQPVFRIRVRLGRTSVPAYGRDVALRPGMLLNADVITDRRNLIQWLFDPLYAAGRRS